MERAEREAAGRLRAAGLRRTPRRVRLMALLLRADRPLSHPELQAALGSYEVDRVSIYRALEAFVARGLVHRAFVEGGPGLYETADRCADDHCHPHFTCRSCGGVTCLVQVSVPVAKDIGKGYVAERQKVHISGLCPACRQKEAGE